MTERGIIYGRASRDPRDLKRSVDDQIEECEQWAKSEGIEVVEVFRDDGRSASAYAKRQREAFEDVLRFVESKRAHILIVWEASRAARDIAAFVRLRDACAAAGVAYSYKGRRFDFNVSSDRFTTGLDALLAERDAGDIRDRNLRTVRRNADRGTPHGRIPYGFRRVYDPSTGVLLTQTPFTEEDPTRLTPEAQVLADAADALLAEGTLRGVCRDLNAREVPTSRKPRKRTLQDDPAGAVKGWDPSTLRQLLRNPTIAGRRVHQGVDIGPASWEPIIEYGKWLRLEALLANPERLTVKAPRGPAPRHLLSGLALCGECGAKMKAATNLSRLPRAYVCKTEGCMRVTVTAPRVDELVEEFLLRYFSRSDFRAALTAAHRRREDLADAGPDIPALIAEREAELAQADALRAEGVLDLRSYGVETRRISEEIADLRAQQVVGVTSGAVRRLLTAETLVEGWKAADLVDQREVIQMLLRVKVLRATVRGRNFDPNRVKIAPGPFLSADV